MWNTLCYTFFHTRCAIYCAWRAGRLTMIPYNNADYRNDWPEAVGEGGALVKRIAEAARGVAIRPNWRTWSCNGALVDNWEYDPRDWGQDDAAPWRDLLERACARIPRGETAEFILNKRDNPLLFVGFREPSPLPWRSVSTEAPSAARGPWRECAVADALGFYHFAPILSQYTSSESLDVPVPPLADYLAGAPPATAWADRAPIAIFRGTATTPLGGATSQRARVVRALCGTEHDAALTGHSVRFRFDATGRIGHTTREETEEACGARIGRAVAMDAQARACQGVVYAEGNAGANRLGGLLAREFLVAVVRSEAPTVVWLRDGTLVAGSDYLDVDQPESLPSALRVLREKPQTARAIACRGKNIWEMCMQRDEIDRRYRDAINASVVPIGPPCGGAAV
jgi:hypothetical protein